MKFTGRTGLFLIARAWNLPPLLALDFGFWQACRDAERLAIARGLS